LIDDLSAVTDAGVSSLVTDRNSCNVWLSVKSTVDSSGSIIIYSFQEHECVSAKVVLHTSHISSSLSFQHLSLLSHSIDDKSQLIFVYSCETQMWCTHEA